VGAVCGNAARTVLWGGAISDGRPYRDILRGLGASAVAVPDEFREHHARIAQVYMTAAISKSVNITIEKRELIPFCIPGRTLFQVAPKC
jgi:hypothetical protein